MSDPVQQDHLIESDGLVAVKAALTRVRMLPHPFSVERVEKHVDTGQTIYEIMGACGCTPGRAYIVLLNGRFIPSEMWKRVRPKPHAEVIIKAVPMDSGSGDQNKTMRTILTVVIVIVAIAIIVATSGSATPLVVTLGSIAATAVSVVGNLALAALLPPKFNNPKPSGRDEPGFSISGARNQAAPGGPIPKVYGRHRLLLSDGRTA